MRLNKIEKYILEKIECDSENPKEKIEFFWKRYISEYGWNINRSKSHVTNLKEYLMGLPSTIHIDFTNYDIVNKLIAWKILRKNSREKTIEAQIELWFSRMACAILSLKYKYKVE